MLFESTLVRTSLCGVLSVDKRVIFLTILTGMRKSDLDIFSLPELATSVTAALKNWICT
jgi:hypothetical protein